MKNRSALRIVATLVLASALVSCAGPNSVAHLPDAQGHVAGFWQGLWNGLTLSFAFFISLVNHDVQVYEVHNNGGWYNWGFVMGNGVFWTLISMHGSLRRSRS